MFIFKNFIIGLLLIACAGLFVNYHKSTLALAQAQQQEQITWNSTQISPADYGGLLALRSALPAEVYRDQLLPQIRQAMQKGHINNADMNALQKNLPNLPSFFLVAAESESWTENLQRNTEKGVDNITEKGQAFGSELSKQAGKLGKQAEELMQDLSHDSKEMLDKLSKAFTKPPPAPPVTPPAPLPEQGKPGATQSPITI